jgi:predicted O-linked N-acetylglucosamine transferase (SPINDLY family)
MGFEALLREGAARLVSGDAQAARHALAAALQINPRSLEALNNLGVACKRLGDPAAALAHFDKALALARFDAVALHNRGAVLFALGRLGEAVDNDILLLSLGVDDDGTRNRLMESLARLDARDDKPSRITSRELQFRRASRWKRAGQFERAVAVYDGPLAYDPAARMLSCCAELRLVPEDDRAVRTARARFARKLAALVANPKALAAGGLEGPLAHAAPAALAYLGDGEKELQATFGALVAEAVALCAPPAAPTRPPRQGEKIRVGFASAFFRDHVNWRMPMSGWVKNLDRRRFDVFGYSLGDLRDDATAAAQAVCTRFTHGRRPVSEWRERILHDAPHVLIYPGLWLDDQSHLLGAQRLAPLQCASWGNPTTTGLPTIDAYLSCAAMEPADASTHYTETLVALPGLSSPIATPVRRDAGPSREALGLREDVPVFWVGHAPAKFLPRHDEVLARIAARVPRAQFIFTRLVEVVGGDIRFMERIDRAFSRFGLNSRDRCVFLPPTGPEAFRARMGVADLYLDCLDWSGFNTTIDALAHDLPIVCSPGASMRARHTAGMLSLMGLGDLVAPDAGAYVEAAVALAGDRDRRAAQRRRIASAKAMLFDDRSAISALEDFIANRFR